MKPLNGPLAGLVREYSDWWDAIGRDLDIANAV
jgi:hypothetical protein